MNIGGKHLPVRVLKKVTASSTLPIKFKSISRSAAALVAAEGDDPEGSADAGEMFETGMRFYRSAKPDEEVPPDMCVSAHRYGPNLIPLSTTAEAGMKYGVAEKCFEVHRFIPRSAVPRHWFLGTADVVVGDNKMAGAREAVQALCIQMFEAEGDVGVCAIARYAPRAKAAPRLVLLSPGMKCLYMTPLPFKDEIKALLWPPVAVPPPTDEQRSAAEALVDALDLDAAALRSLPEEEAKVERIRDLLPDARASLRRPKDTPNPTHHWCFELVKHKLLHPGQTLPPLPWTLVRPLQPDTGLFDAAQRALTGVSEVSPVGPMLKPSGKRMWNETADESTATVATRQRVLDAGAVESLPSLDLGGASIVHVDSGRPVETFRQGCTTNRRIER
jgi:hypothetical protein